VSKDIICVSDGSLYLLYCCGSVTNDSSSVSGVEYGLCIILGLVERVERVGKQWNEQTASSSLLASSTDDKSEQWTMGLLSAGQRTTDRPS